MLNGYIYTRLTTQYQGECGHIEGHAYSIFFSRLPEALCGLMTKQTPFMHIHNIVSSPSIALIKHSLNYIITDSLKSGQPLFSRQITCPQLHISNLPRSGHLTILRSSDTDQARMDTRSTSTGPFCSTKITSENGQMPPLLISFCIGQPL